MPRGQPAQPARPVPWRQPRRLGPEREELPPLHDRHRRPDAARDRLRHGHPARRRRRHRRRRARRRRDRLLRRRRHRAGRRQRVVRLRRGQQRPGRVLLPEQPVGHLRAQRAPDPHPALPAGPRLRLPRRAGRRQRRAGRLRRDPAGAQRGPLRQRPDLHRGLHLPHGRPHHLGRPDQVPRLRRGRGVEAPRPDRAAEVLPRAHAEGRPGRSSTRSTARPTSWPSHVREGCLYMPDPDARLDVRPHLRRGAPAGRGGAQGVRRLPRRLRGRGEPTDGAA